MNEDDNETEEHLFTCKKCGGHDLIVKEFGIKVQSMTETQECTCGKNEDGIAYEKKYILHSPFVEFYYLDEDHHFLGNKPSDYGYDEFEDEEVIDEEIGDIDDEEDIIEENTYCEDCYDPTQEVTPEHDLNEEDEFEDVEYFVICAKCQREIEFGWSHPDRGGRIWPAECTDFNPWMCCPEPRYKDAWAKKNWLRPTDDR